MCCTRVFYPQMWTLAVWRRLGLRSGTSRLVSSGAARSITTAGPRGRYQDLVDRGELEPDARQLSLSHRFQTLFDDVTKASRGSNVKGLYIHGGVGCGKTMMMDLFHGSVSDQGIKSCRTHFHTFMLDVHQQMHDITQRHKRQGTYKGDPLPQVAESIGQQWRVLCFDEFQVTDVADAFVLNRLLATLLDKGHSLIDRPVNSLPGLLLPPFPALRLRSRHD